MMNAVWVGVMILFGLLEAATVSLVSIWFVVGAIAGLLASILGGSVTGQFGAFVLVSGLALVLTRPLVRHFTTSRAVRTNADRVLEKIGRVTEAVTADAGAVRVDGKEWSARTEDPSGIPVGAQVEIERIEGVKLFVTRM